MGKRIQRSLQKLKEKFSISIDTPQDRPGDNGNATQSDLNGVSEREIQDSSVHPTQISAKLESQRASPSQIDVQISRLPAQPSTHIIAPRPFHVINQKNGTVLHANRGSLISTRTVTREGDKDIETEIIQSGNGSSPMIRRVSTFKASDDLAVQSPDNNDNEKGDGDNDYSDDDDEEKIIVLPNDLPLRRPKSPRLQPYHDDTSDNIFPSGIDCNLTVTFNEKSVFPEPFKLKDFLWYEVGSYGKLRQECQQLKEKFVEMKLCEQTHKIYPRYVSCYLRGTRNQDIQEFNDKLLVDTDDDEDTTDDVDKDKALAEPAIRTVCGFIHQYPYEHFDLNFHFDYSSIERRFTNLQDTDFWLPNPGQFQQDIRWQYEDKMALGRQTINKQEYFSRADQHILITEANARRLVELDSNSNPRLTRAEKDKLIAAVMSRPANVLQAVCAYDCIPMRFLYHFLFEDPHADQKHSDSLDSLRLDSKNICVDELCIKHHRGLVKNIYRFNPEMIKPDPVPSIMAEHAVVPVRLSPEPYELGRGAFSIVYGVDIDPHYQLISHNVTKSYALKTFDANYIDKQAFDREIKMLLYLSSYLPHDHILVHITSWEQNSKYYILYEKAHSNLRVHMDNESFRGGNLDEKHVLWFFTQLRGLSDAVRRIHTCRESILENNSKKNADGNKATTAKRASVKTRKTGVVGRHHDIKPENILAFDLPRHLPTLKLSDFGAGRFSPAATNNSALPASRVRGARTYAGPESHPEMREKMSRPLDMWALGCVFLEMTLWFFGEDKPDGKRDFADMRLLHKLESSPREFDHFWDRTRTGEYVRNGAVTFVLNRLQNTICKDMEPFQSLIELIRKLLEIKPQSRMKAKDLYNGMDATYCKAVADLNVFPSRYSDLLKRNRHPEQKLSLDIPKVEFGVKSRIDDELSTPGRSRAHSTTESRRLEDSEIEAIPALSGADGAQTITGQQFEHSPPTECLNDDSGGLNLEGSAAPNRDVKHVMEQVSKTFSEVS